MKNTKEEFYSKIGRDVNLAGVSQLTSDFSEGIEDVAPALLISGCGLRSSLMWADFLRNIGMRTEIEHH